LPVAKEQNPIVAESHSFASVIEPWHRTHNADAALALLDAHEQRFPSGHMVLETRVLRAEIYLAQGRENEALAVLDSVALSGIPRARELQTVRGELRIKAGRCGEGKRDLGEVLEKSVADSLAKRAAQALHHCP
jgi:Flp pilus assembly protein TadD